MAFRTRIRAVRFKSGGEVRLLPSQRELQHNKIVGILKDSVRSYLELYEGRMAGFALVVWDVDMRSSATLRMTPTSQVNTTQAPAFVGERLRREVSIDDAEEAVRDMFGIPDKA